MGRGLDPRTPEGQAPNPSGGAPTCLAAELPRLSSPGEGRRGLVRCGTRTAPRTSVRGAVGVRSGVDLGGQRGYRLAQELGAAEQAEVAVRLGVVAQGA